MPLYLLQRTESWRGVNSKINSMPGGHSAVRHKYAQIMLYWKVHMHE